MTATGQLRNLYPGWRIFVFGEEVTEDCTSCTINWNDGRAPNISNFTLVNKGAASVSPDDSDSGVFDRYIITEKDIHALYDDVNLDEEASAARAKLPELQTRLATITEFLDSLTQEGVPTSTSNFSVETGATKRQAQEEYRQEVENYAQHIDRLVRRRLRNTIRDDRKRRVLSAKIGERVQIAQPTLDVTKTEGAKSASSTAALKGDALKYSFQQGDCIFQGNDPVRVFWRDPQQPKTWFHMCAGFVSSWNDTVDANNKAQVTIHVEDPTRILRYARVSTNPGIFDIKAIQQTEDLVLRTFFNAGFAELTLPELMYTIVFGPELATTTARLRPQAGGTDSPVVPYRRVSVNGALETTVPKEGAGSFNFERSLILTYGPKAEGGDSETTLSIDKPEIAVPDLATYQAIVDHRVSESDLDTMLDPKAKAQGYNPRQRLFRTGDSREDELPLGLAPDPTIGEIRPEAIISEIGRNPHLYPVDGGRLIILLPGSLGASTNRDVVTRDLISSVATQTTFRNRLAMIYDAIEQIEFSFYASPKGDLILEPPLYDFNPSDFGEEPIVLDDSTLTPQSIGVVVPISPRAQTTVRAEANQTSAETIRQAFGTTAVGSSFGPYAPHYRVSKEETIQFSRTFSDERIRTQMVSTWNLVKSREGVGTAQSIGIAPRAYTIRSLVPQYGVRTEVVPPTVFMSDPKAANVFVNVKLNQMNADARSHTYEVLPRLRPAPNRPLLFARRNEIATVRSVSHSLVWNQSMSTTLGVNYVRGWDGNIADDGVTLVHSPIGGKAGRTLDYRTLFGLKPAPVESSKSGAGVPPDPGDSGGAL